MERQFPQHSKNCSDLRGPLTPSPEEPSPQPDSIASPRDGVYHTSRQATAAGSFRNPTSSWRFLMYRWLLPSLALFLLTPLGAQDSTGTKNQAGNWTQWRGPSGQGHTEGNAPLA